jgi:hypothetical protein
VAGRGDPGRILEGQPLLGAAVATGQDTVNPNIADREVVPRALEEPPAGRKVLRAVLQLRNGAVPNLKLRGDAVTSGRTGRRERKATKAARATRAKPAPQVSANTNSSLSSARAGELRTRGRRGADRSSWGNPGRPSRARWTGLGGSG